MLKNILLLTLVSILFSSCTIVGNYYLINSSERKVNVSIELNPRYLLMTKNITVKSSKHTKRKVKFNAYKKMKTQPFTIDSLTSTLHFPLDGKHIAHLGSSYNAREIGTIKIIDNKSTHTLDSSKGKFKSRGLMKYVMLYEYE